MSQFRKDKGFSQEQFGKKLGLSQATYQTYESGRSSIPPEVQAKIKRLGYEGPWPQEETKEPAQAEYITREEFAEWRGWAKAGMENALVLIKDLDRRVRELENRVGSGG